MEQERQPEQEVIAAARGLSAGGCSLLFCRLARASCTAGSVWSTALRARFGFFSAPSASRPLAEPPGSFLPKSVFSGCSASPSGLSLSAAARFFACQARRAFRLYGEEEELAAPVSFLGLPMAPARPTNAWMREATCPTTSTRLSVLYDPSQLQV